MLFITPKISIPMSEIEFQAIRAQGPGGQNVNKVSSAIHLRFDINTANLGQADKARILTYKDKRISAAGVIVIKAQNHRTQDRNREEALKRLQALLQAALKRQKYRVPTKPSYGAVKRRLKKKSERSTTKSLRGKVRDYE